MSTTNDKIIEEIKKYIDDSFYDYAVMIDGEWGSGKTYFVKNELMKEVEDHIKNKNDEDSVKKIIYLSLYGMKSIDDISKQMVYEAYLSNLNDAKSLAKAGIKFSKILLPTVFDVINNKFGINIDKDKISETICDFASLKNTLLIFDDLERCDCPINEVLGYINSFVEQDHLKVIIVANQKELGKNFYNKNLELKYLVASDSKILIKEKNENEKILIEFGLNNKDEKLKSCPTFKIEDIEHRANELFGQDLIYKKIKEKLIGNTFYYEPDLKYIFYKIIDKSEMDINLKIYLKDQCDEFISFMNLNGHCNIRTFQFFLSKINGLYEAIRKNVSDDGRGSLEIFIKYIVKYTFRTCVRYRIGKQEYDWTILGECDYKNYKSESVLAYKFVDDYVMKSYIREDVINRMYKYHLRNIIAMQDIRKLSYSCKEMSEKSINDQIGNINDNIEKDIYKFDQYESIIALFLTLEEIGFSKDLLDGLTAIMKEKIKQNGKTQYKFAKFNRFSNKEIILRYNQIMDELQDEVYKLNNESHYDILKNILRHDNWAERISSYAENYIQRIVEKGEFLSIIDIEYLSEKLSAAEPKDVSDVRRAINEIYSNGNLNKEYPLLIELKNKILETGNEGYDIVKKYQINSLVKDIEEITELKETNENTENTL